MTRPIVHVEEFTVPCLQCFPRMSLPPPIAIHRLPATTCRWHIPKTPAVDAGLYKHLAFESVSKPPSQSSFRSHLAFLHVLDLRGEEAEAAAEKEAAMLITWCQTRDKSTTSPWSDAIMLHETFNHHQEVSPRYDDIYNKQITILESWCVSLQSGGQANRRNKHSGVTMHDIYGDRDREREGNTLSRIGWRENDYIIC